jgi:tRNA A37 threonylcarbamoyladenosine synthetase subunit TsaC/SUA5/YrdC
MAVLDVAADAARAFAAMQAGGIAILPNDVGYSLIAGEAAALKKIFDTKRRAPTKLNAMLGNDDHHREIHVVGQRARDILQAIVKDYDLPLGVIAPCRTDHPLLRSLDADIYRRSTSGDTLLMLMNAGRFHAEITRLSFASGYLLFGSSANLSLAGTKFRVKDIEPDIVAIADVVIDYGLMKYHPWAASSTLLDIETCAVHRVGVAYENIADILKRHFAVDLPPHKTRAAAGI